MSNADKNEILRREKSELRQIFAAKRNDLPFRREKDCKIKEKVIKLLSGNFNSLFVYVSFGSEADTHDIIRALFGGVKIFVPHTSGGIMRAVLLDSADRPEIVGKYGNVYTDEEAAVLVSDDLPEAALVPLLAFDDRLYRLGYGGGFYDRYLALSGCLSVGLAYDEQKADRLPVEETDVKLDLVVTPTGIIGR